MAETLSTPPSSPPRRIFTATFIIGASGQGKTSLAATFAEYLWETFQRVLLFYSLDGGAFPTVIQKRIHQGLIRAWRMRTRSAPGLAFETCYLASKGYWPRRINPATGESAPAVELVPPVSSTYTLSCGQGHLVKVAPALSSTPVFCPTCKAMVPPGDLKVAEETRQTRGFEAVGGIFFDGLTSMCGWFMGELDERAGRGELEGEKSALGGRVVSGNLKFGGNNRAHYGFAQTRAKQIVDNSLSIPNLVEGPIFTALTDEASEGGLMVVGPLLAGSAKTPEAPQWAGNVLEARVMKDEKDRPVRRLYLSEYIDEQNRRHLLKNSGPGTLPPWLEDPPIDVQKPDAKGFFTGFNLGNFFRLLDQALVQSLAEQTAGMPGLASQPTDYGDESVATPTAAAPTTSAAPIAAPAPQPSTTSTSAAPARPTARPTARAASPASPPSTSVPASPTTTAAAAPPVSTPAAARGATPAAASTSTGARASGRPVAGPPPPPGARPPQRAPGT